MKTPYTLADIYQFLGLELGDETLRTCEILGLAPLNSALFGDITFFGNIKYKDQLNNCAASFCLVSEKNKTLLPAHIHAIVCANPAAQFTQLSRLIHADSMKTTSFYAEPEDFSNCIIHEDSEIERGVTIDPYAVIGKGVVIGQGSIIGVGAVIGANVTIGRNTYIGANVTLQHAHIGNNVVLHPGVRIGQDGFGFQLTAGAPEKVPQVGRVIIQDNVEIGANTAIDRGSVRDTVIGDSTKIDNHVQIGHNVMIGRNCVIVAFCALAGSSTLEDNVTLAGNVSLNNHITIGEGTQILATSAVKDNIPPNAIYGGAPAKPVREWFREITALQKLAQNSKTLGLGNKND
jgi:UDP-3-O-[3-hydroxymyristoyl] glucosamine N-acyltransferase